MDIKEAVSSPRFHSQWLPDVIQVEPRSLSNDVQIISRKKDIKLLHTNGIHRRGKWYFNLEDFVSGGGDSRGETSAVGY